MASGKEFRDQLRKALAERARQQRIARGKWQRAAPQPGPGMARKPAEPPGEAPPPPVPAPVPLAERYWRCRGCDVEWHGTDPACWCCGQVAA